MPDTGSQQSINDVGQLGDTFRAVRFESFSPSSSGSPRGP
jgi:hypothetical protein